MIQLTQLKLPYGHSEIDLEAKIRKNLKLSDKQSFTYQITKKSIDARKKPDLFLVYSCAIHCENESQIIKKAKNPNASLMSSKKYELPTNGTEVIKYPPVIIGAGPAGLFAAFTLVEAGFKPILLERGKKIEERTKDVEEFWKTGVLNTASNVQFGEGGAGTFSDGKLNTVVKDPAFRNGFVLETFVRFGAPEHILYENKPHIGTDILSQVVANMRNYLIEKGAEVRFETCVTDFVINKDTQNIEEIVCKNANGQAETIPVSLIVLALGHSARDTFRCLYHHNLPMEVKSFAVGFRVEHPQEMINESQYGKQSVAMPASPYKVTANFPNGRGVYSFCMCPGGYVVNASSQKEQLVVNGMSYSGRDSSTANSAIIVSVSPEDFGSTDALAGMEYQEKLEKKAYALASGKIPQQLFVDFCKNRVSTAYGTFQSNIKGASSFANLRGLMSLDMEESFIEGMKQFGRKIKGFDRPDAILSGVESRTSSPLRMLRDENYESDIKGIYPCGEGAGFAGGITSAAMDGVKVAEAIIKKYHAI